MPDGTSKPKDQDGTTPAAAKSGPPSLSLPKGGGAIRGMGEKFAVNPATGTGSLSVPILTSPGRSGVGPKLSLSYDSGSGNGVFGFGWSLSLPAITRRTDRGLPQYRDSDESDVFILAGAEDLVPLLQTIGGSPQRDVTLRTVAGARYSIERYRPRIEALFSRIERWTELTSGESHWRTISRDNMTTTYGRTAESRIADPADSTRVFSWLICESYDDRGNAIRYDYKGENSDGVDTTPAHEKNRTEALRASNRYLKSIKYGNRVSRLVDPDPVHADWMFEVVLDYGEHAADDPRPGDAGQWLCRHDRFSTYRAGFEVRTYRLCQRILMFHHFPGEVGVERDCLVRSTDIVYRDRRGNAEDRRRGHPIGAFIASITQSAYRRNGGGYDRRSLPPLELEYSDAALHDEVQSIDSASLENLPYGLDGAIFQWVDLDGEGVSGILTEQADGWLYKRNLSPASSVRTTSSQSAAWFGPLEPVASKPSTRLSGQMQFMDLAGDGRLDAVQLDSNPRGFFERSIDEAWEPFRAFESWPDVDPRDPNLRFVDLDGDGQSDLLVTADEVFTWFPSRGEAGFGQAAQVRNPADEERGPRLVFADGVQTVYLADMSGDGLTDLVRIRNGEICYWPNLGYGRFGPKVLMDRSPHIEDPQRFDERRVRLADIDGSGDDRPFLSGERRHHDLAQRVRQLLERSRISCLASHLGQRNDILGP